MSWYASWHECAPRLHIDSRDSIWPVPGRSEEKILAPGDETGSPSVSGRQAKQISPDIRSLSLCYKLWPDLIYGSKGNAKKQTFLTRVVSTEGVFRGAKAANVPSWRRYIGHRECSQKLHISLIKKVVVDSGAVEKSFHLQRTSGEIHVTVVSGRLYLNSYSEKFPWIAVGPVWKFSRSEIVICYFLKNYLGFIDI